MGPKNPKPKYKTKGMGNVGHAYSLTPLYVYRSLLTMPTLDSRLFSFTVYTWTSEAPQNVLIFNLNLELQCPSHLNPNLE